MAPGQRSRRRFRHRHRHLLDRRRGARDDAHRRTCTAGSASTSPTRCTATSPSPRTSRASSAARHPDELADAQRRAADARSRPAARRRHVHRPHRSSALCATRSTWFETLIDPNDEETLLVERHGATLHLVKQMGSDGWLGVGWPTQFGGKGFGDIEQQIFTNEAVRADVRCRRSRCRRSARRCRCTATTNRRPVPAPRSWPATSTSPSATPSPTPAPTSRPSRRRRCSTATTTSSTGGRSSPPAATTPTTSGSRCALDPHRAQAQRDLDPHRRHHRPRLHLDADHHRRRRPPRQRHLLHRRQGAGVDARRRRATAEADHRPAQPRARHARPGRRIRASPPACGVGVAPRSRRLADRSGSRRRPRACSDQRLRAHPTNC